VDRVLFEKTSTAYIDMLLKDKISNKTKNCFKKWEALKSTMEKSDLLTMIKGLRINQYQRKLIHVAIRMEIMFYTKVAHIQLAPTTSTNISGIFADSTRLSVLPSTLQLGIYLRLGSETTMLSWCTTISRSTSKDEMQKTFSTIP
jgi:uncharacterized membrane protein YbaN (DUF454 family)